VDNFYLAALIKELTSQVLGRTVARLSLEGTTLRIDLRLASGRQLVASLDRTSPALYLSNLLVQPSRIEKHAAGYFLSLLRKHLSEARLISLEKDPRDRIVHIDFERLDAGDRQVKVCLQLFLTGRSANAVLVDAQGNVIAQLFDQEQAFDPSHQPEPGLTTDLTAATAQLTADVTEPQVLSSVFGSSLGPQLQQEFRARCKRQPPAIAIKSLIEDLLNSRPLPLLYSRLPLDKIDEIVIDPKRDLMLSHIELVQAEGMLRVQFSSLSDAADQYYFSHRRAALLRAEYQALKQKLSREINKQNSAIKAIESDRLRFESPERLKRFGDLLLANLANARVVGTTATVLDYFDPDQPEIQIDIPEGSTLKEAASDYFARYQKSRRALAAIESRERDVSRKLDRLKELVSRLEEERTSFRIENIKNDLDPLLGAGKHRSYAKGPRPNRKTSDLVGRRFKSTDGYEIVVGRNDRDNDVITFRIARPQDIWLHAADYPGSHAIVRNPNRETLPQRTITEAAELAAFYSQAKREGKAAVHYAQKKFVSKPPRAKPGLVRLSSFKTIIVEPRCDLERLE
jgi:predicted ribosome quality control (RQC) complex YloA/Tae2 family protein